MHRCAQLYNHIAARRYGNDDDDDDNDEEEVKNIVHANLRGNEFNRNA